MKKLACTLLLVIGATVALQATPRYNSQGRHQEQDQHQRNLPNPETRKQNCGFAQVSLHDLEITETEIRATIDGKAVPIRTLFIGDKGTVFVETCSPSQQEYSGRIWNQPFPQRKTKK